MRPHTMLTHCTLTGVDVHVGTEKLARLSLDYPLVEWGFLYSPKRQGMPGRYPPVDFLQVVLQYLPEYVRVALHVCGSGVHDLLCRETVVTGLVDLVAKRGGRVQLNFNQSKDPVDLGKLQALLQRYPTVQFITQHNLFNESVWIELGAGQNQNHAVLFDASGGRGESPVGWPSQLSVPCGYAGGLGPDNLASEYERIVRAAGNRPFWTDSEGKLRPVDDKFCLETAVKMLETLRECIRSTQRKAA